MSRVSLVFTMHEEIGLANVSELLAILTRVQPQVIFLEVPTAAFDDYYGTCSRANLESMAVRQYRKSRQAELVPVDLPTPEREFFENAEYLRLRIRGESPAYRQLMMRDSDYVHAYGFAYLNSDYCSKLWSEIYEDMRNTIRRLGEPKLVEIYESWKTTNDLRENAMMKNVQNYCRENTFDSSVLLVGAAHRQHIIDKSKGHAALDSSEVQWDFSSWANQTTRESVP